MSRLQTIPVLIALVSILVLGTRVDLDFQRIRTGISGARPAEAGRLSFDLPDVGRLAGAPAALVVRLRGGAEAVTVRVLFDGVPLASVTVAAGDEARVDAAVTPSDGQTHRLDLVGDREDWRLRDAEIANVHGFSRGLASLVIAPAGRSRDHPLPLWAFIPLALGLLAWRPRWDWPSRGPWRALHRAAVALALLLLVTTLAAAWVTPFTVLLAPHTALLLIAVLYAERGAEAWRRLRPQLESRKDELRAVLAYVPYVATVAVFLWAIGQFYVPKAGFTAFIGFGDSFSHTASPTMRQIPRVVWEGWGYDGQFYAELALDPLLRDPATPGTLDTPGYRARRILFPGLAHVVGLGHPWATLHAYALLNVVAWLALGWLLLRWLPPGNARMAAAWVACMLSHGLLTSVTRALTDGPSMLLLALIVWTIQHNRSRAAALLLGIATLGRDSNLFGAAVLAPARPSTRQFARLAMLGPLVAGPFALWLFYLWSVGVDLTQSGAENFTAPMVGYLQQWSISIGMVQPRMRAIEASGILTMMALTVQAAVLLARPEWQSPWWRVGIGYVVLVALVGTAVWEGQPPAITRVVLPMTIAFNVLLPRGRWFWPLLVLGNLNVPDGVVLLMPWLVGSHYIHYMG